MFIIIKSEFFPLPTVERKNPSHTLAAVVVTCRDILQGEDYFLVDDRVVVPEGLGDR